jgi:tetratricopeptide (TPR) repeat protein
MNAAQGSAGVVHQCNIKVDVWPQVVSRQPHMPGWEDRHRPSFLSSSDGLALAFCCARKNKICGSIGPRNFGISQSLCNIGVVGLWRGANTTPVNRNRRARVDCKLVAQRPRLSLPTQMRLSLWSLPAVSAIDRLRRQQLMHEAEGYLELALLFGDRWPLPCALRDCLAQRSLAVINHFNGMATYSPQLQLIKGQALRMQERYQEALEPLNQAAKDDPQNIDAWLALGWCYKRTGRVDLAIESLEEALDLEPGSALVNYNLACYWSLARNKRQALAYLSQALSLDSGFRHLIDAEHDFDSFRADPEFQAITSVAV